MPAKLKFAFYWAASCGGCEIAVLDINEKLLELAEQADIVFWPVAMDIKYEHVRQFPEQFIDVCFFNGSIRNSEQEELAHLLRAKSKVLVAFGSCAQHGCIPGLANLFSRESILATVYRNGPSIDNPDKRLPSPAADVVEGRVTLPEFYDRVRPLDRVVTVDYYLPGCPPPVPLILDAVHAVVTSTLPASGSVLAPAKSLCEECERNKPGPKKMPALKRVHEIAADPGVCFLEQGVICMGPATRGGCGRLCINANWPCTGCMGPTPGVADQGAKMVSALAAILKVDDEQQLPREEIEKLLAQVKDPVGTFYMYGLASATISHRRQA